MNNIPEKYPTELSDDELIKLIREYTIKATAASRSTNYVRGPSYWKEISELGQTEIRNRIQKNLLFEISNLKDEIVILKKDNKKSGQINQRLSVITIILAVITIFFGYESLSISRSGIDNGNKDAVEMRIIQENNNKILHSIYTEIQQNRETYIEQKKKK